MLTLGQVVHTASITNDTFANLYYPVFVLECLLKHLDYDFGAICKEDHNANMRAIQQGGRVFSMYLIPEDLKIDAVKIYINIEADRSHTTVLYPHEFYILCCIPSN